MFTCYPKYNITLGEKDFDNSLSLYFKFLRNYFMKECNNVITMYFSALYTLSISNYVRIYQDKSFIKISDECGEIAELIEPQKLDRIEIPTNYILGLEDNIFEENHIVTPQNPGVPLTTCQPTEFLYNSGNSIPHCCVSFIGIHIFTKIEQSLLCSGSSIQYTTCITVYP